MEAAAIGDLFDEYGDATPGCALAVVHGGETLVAGYGMADLERRLTELEKQKLHAEREVSDAFAAGDHVKGRKLSNTLAKVSRQLYTLYEEWEEASRA